MRQLFEDKQRKVNMQITGVPKGEYQCTGIEQIQNSRKCF